MEDGGQAILQAAEAGNERAQLEVEAAPKLNDAFYLQAFNELSTLRTIGMSAGPIPLDKITWYAERLDYDLVEQDAFEYVIRTVDVAWLNLQAEAASKRAKRAK